MMPPLMSNRVKWIKSSIIIQNVIFHVKLRYMILHDNLLAVPALKEHINGPRKWAIWRVVYICHEPNHGQMVPEEH